MNFTFKKGMGIGGWLTNYKRFNVLPLDRRRVLSIGDFEHFDSYITRDDIQYIASLGMDHIRLGFDQIVIEEAPGSYRERIWKLLHDFVDWCREAGIAPVLNMHKAIGNYCDIKEDVTLFDSTELQDRFTDIWIEFEKQFHNDNTVMFELLNEVRGPVSKQWNALAARVRTAIRKLNPERVIIIGSAHHNGCGALKELDDYSNDSNIIYTWHFYGPYPFTHQRGVLCPGPLYYNREMPYPSDIEPYQDYERFVDSSTIDYAPYKHMDIQWLRDYTKPAFDFQATHPKNIVWCGEFGTIRHCRIQYRENWMHDMILLLKEHDMPYSVWNYLSTPNDGNRFSLVDDDSRKILSPRLARIIRGELD